MTNTFNNPISTSLILPILEPGDSNKSEEQLKNSIRDIVANSRSILGRILKTLKRAMKFFVKQWAEGARIQAQVAMRKSGVPPHHYYYRRFC
jgi:hypothetical protein